MLSRTAASLRTGVAVPVLIDLAVVVLFVVVGRDEHQAASTVGDVAAVAAPFALGVLAGSALALALGRPLRSLRSGIVVLISALTLGMLLRRLVWDRGTAATFVVVTSAFLAVGLLGWRTGHLAWTRCRRATTDRT